MPHDNQSTKEDGGVTKALEKVMGTLTVGLVFRHFVSGGVFVLVFSLCRDGERALSVLSEAMEKQATTLGMAVLLAGTLIYSLHRATTHPAFEVLRHGVIKLSGRPRFGWIERLILPSGVKELMLSRWDAGDRFLPSSAHISSWGDYIHMQYTAALALVLGMLAAREFGGAGSCCPHGSMLMWTAIVFAVSGFYSDCRKHLVEMALYARLKAPTHD